MPRLSVVQEHEWNEADAVAVPLSSHTRVEPDSTVLHQVYIGQVKHKEIGDLQLLVAVVRKISPWEMSKTSKQGQ